MRTFTSAPETATISPLVVDITIYLSAVLLILTGTLSVILRGERLGFLAIAAGMTWLWTLRTGVRPVSTALDALVSLRREAS